MPCPLCVCPLCPLPYRLALLSRLCHSPLHVFNPGGPSTGGSVRRIHFNLSCCTNTTTSIHCVLTEMIPVFLRSFAPHKLSQSTVLKEGTNVLECCKWGLGGFALNLLRNIWLLQLRLTMFQPQPATPNHPSHLQPPTLYLQVLREHFHVMGEVASTYGGYMDKVGGGSNIQQQPTAERMLTLLPFLSQHVATTCTQWANLNRPIHSCRILLVQHHADAQLKEYTLCEPSQPKHLHNGQQPRVVPTTLAMAPTTFADHCEAHGTIVKVVGTSWHIVKVVEPL